VTALEQSISGLEIGHTDATRCVKAEAEVRLQLEQVTKNLEKYQSIYGDASSLSPDMHKLSDQLRQKEDEIQRLRLLDAQRAQVTLYLFPNQRTSSLNLGQAETSLYAEIDRLSAAWETLDRQVNSKVFELAAMEERVVKIGLEVRYIFLVVDPEVSCHL
jgi:E3 ubiquitin-protein ligase BRE1